MASALQNEGDVEGLGRVGFRSSGCFLIRWLGFGWKDVGESWMMNRKLQVLVLCAIFLFHAAADEVSDGILGQWVTKDGKARVEIVRDGDTYRGSIVWLNEPLYPEGDKEAGKEKHDRYNPDPSLRDRPIIGLCILSGFTYEGNGTWSGGSVYDPESGNTYRGKIRMEGKDRLVLRGFIGITLFGRTEIWERYQPTLETDTNTEKAS